MAASEMSVIELHQARETCLSYLAYVGEMQSAPTVSNDLRSAFEDISTSLSAAISIIEQELEARGGEEAKLSP
jgi:hypothetical protein